VRSRPIVRGMAHPHYSRSSAQSLRGAAALCAFAREFLLEIVGESNLGSDAGTGCKATGNHSEREFQV